MCVSSFLRKPLLFVVTIEDNMIQSEEYESDINNKISNSLADVFQQAQQTYAGHRKHIAVLKKIQLKAAQQGYSDAFNYWFNKLVTSVLPLKKNEIVGDRIVKLIAAFIASLDKENEILRNERIKAAGEMNNDSETANTQEDGDDPVLTEKEKMTTMFVDVFIRHILRGIESKDKNVRFRVMQLLVVIMDNIGEIDVNLYNLLLWSLNKRIYDKEPMVRIQAVFCLTKLQSDADENSDDDIDENLEDTKATDTLMQLIQNDPSAEVRRATMLNLINNEDTRAHILERARDVNPINRRLIYSRVLKSMGKSCFDDLNSKILDQLIQWGLEDREEHVRKACQKLISHHWINMFDGDLIELLERLDVSNSSCAVAVVNTLFKRKPEILTKINFTEELWSELTVESIFLFRCFFIYCLENDLVDDVDKNFPEASRLANYMNNYISKRYDIQQDNSISGLEKNHLEFILEQLLLTAHRYDYSDEVGRRSMLTTIRNMLRLEDLSDALIKAGHEVLNVLSINERDFISMTIEIINDIRDDDIEKQEEEERLKAAAKNNDKGNRSSSNGTFHNSVDANVEDDDEDDDEDAALNSFHSAVDNLVNDGDLSNDNLTSSLRVEREARPRAILLCLTRASYMLELVSETINGNILITSLIDTLIMPAVRNSETTIRELGVRSLGLCCLLDQQMAADSMYILGMCVSKGNSTLKHIALQVIVDIFSIHGNSVVDGEGKVDSISIHKIFYKVLKNEEDPECQVIAAEGLCKLYLADVFIDDDLFEALILSYFSPVNARNEALVQAFAFCIPVYCFSQKVHQQRMCRMASDILLRLCILWEGLQSSEDPTVDKEGMLKPNVIFQQLTFWTDPRKIVNQHDDVSRTENTQLLFLSDVLKVLSQIESKNIKKMILTNINTFYVTSYQDVTITKDILTHIEDILDNENIDNPSRHALEKFKETIVQAIQESSDRCGEQKNSTDSNDELTNEQYSQILESSRVSDDDMGDENTDNSNNTSDPSVSNVNMTASEMVTDTPSKNIRKRDRESMEHSSVLRGTAESSPVAEKDLTTKSVSFMLPSDSNSSSEDNAMEVDEDIIMTD